MYSFTMLLFFLFRQLGIGSAQTVPNNATMATSTTLTTSAVASTTQGGPPTVLVPSVPSYTTATASIVATDGPTTTYKLLTMSGSTLGLTVTFVPTITVAPSSYGEERHFSTSVQGVQLLISVRAECSLFSLSDTPYLVSCTETESVGGSNLPTYVSGIASSTVAAINGFFSVYTVPMVIETAVPAKAGKTSDSPSHGISTLCILIAAGS